MRYKQSLRSVRSKQKPVKHPEELDSELPIPETTEPQSQDILQLQQTYGNQAVSRLLTAPKGGPSRLQPQAVLRHQQTYGNQAVLRLLSAQKGAGSPGVIQRVVMTLEEFQAATPGNRSKSLQKIDSALKTYKKKGIETEFTHTYLAKLLEAIDNWLDGDHENNARIAQVETLKDQTERQQRAVNKRLDEPKKQVEEREGVKIETGVTKEPDEDSKFTDFDGKQYRVSGKRPNRIIEEVKRKVSKKGKVTYYATGQVVDFKNNMPVVVKYDPGISLGDWYPRVTHLNGMAVKPQSGIESALALHESINQKLDEQMQDEGVALDQDVLYTYSAQKGEGGVKSTVLDVYDCIKGKVRVEDTVTEEQENIMLDAVRNEHRTTVSAHSRGTIKTDNAVRNVYSMLKAEYAAELLDTAEVKKKARARARRDQRIYAGQGVRLDINLLLPVYQKEIAGEIGGKNAKEKMDTYIQLIYAGNAVQYPSSVLKINMFVGKVDPISISVGSYTNIGAKIGSGNTRTTLHKVSGGHGFVENYSEKVGEKIAQDITEERRDNDNEEDL